MPLDVSDKTQIANLWSKVPADLRNVDILGWSQVILRNSRYLPFYTVNNAGYVLGVERVGAIKEDDIEGMFNLNVLGLISMTQLLING